MHSAQPQNVTTVPTLGKRQCPIQSWEGGAECSVQSQFLKEEIDKLLSNHSLQRD